MNAIWEFSRDVLARDHNQLEIWQVGFYLHHLFIINYIYILHYTLYIIYHIFYIYIIIYFIFYILYFIFYILFGTFFSPAVSVTIALAEQAFSRYSI